LKIAYDHLPSVMLGHLEIVDRISGCPYGSNNIDVENSWIIYVPGEALILDGPEHYIVVDKRTGDIKDVMASSCA
jgi:hypothetical protein